MMSVNVPSQWDTGGRQDVATPGRLPPREHLVTEDGPPRPLVTSRQASGQTAWVLAVSSARGLMIETLTRAGHRHAVPETIEPKRERSGRPRRPIGVGTHGHRIPRCW